MSDFWKLWEEVDSIFDYANSCKMNSNGSNYWKTSYEVDEEDGSKTYSIPVPGVKKDEVSVSYSDETIFIKLKEEKSFILWKDLKLIGQDKIDPKKIEVSLNDGVLIIKTFLKEDEKPIDIKIK